MVESCLIPALQPLLAFPARNRTWRADGLAPPELFGNRLERCRQVLRLAPWAD
jgi:hypothetical protein